MPSHVTVKELADELGLDRSALRKYLVKHGIEMMRVRSPESRGQQSLALTQEDAERVIALRESEGYETGNGATALAGPALGVFYVIQLVPELTEARVKLGWTGSITGRLAAHRITAPTAVVVKTWPCRQRWEGAAIDSVTAGACVMLGNEVFDCTSVSDVLARGDAFFAAMPALSSSVESDTGGKT